MRSDLECSAPTFNKRAFICKKECQRHGDQATEVGLILCYLFGVLVARVLQEACVIGR